MSQTAQVSNAQDGAEDAKLTSPPEGPKTRSNANENMEAQRVERLDSLAGGTDEFVDARS